MKLSRLFIILLCFFLVSCEIERKFEVDSLNEFVDSLKSEYPFIDSTKIRKSQGHVKIKIYFSSDTGDKFDESIYEDFRLYFLDVENQNEIIEEYSPEDLEGDDYPTIMVEFIDSDSKMSHDILTPVDRITYNTTWQTKTDMKNGIPFGTPITKLINIIIEITCLSYD